MPKVGSDQWLPKSLIDEWQAKAFALDRLEQYAGAINYGGKPLRWDGRTRGSLLRAIEESDREFREMDRKVKTPHEPTAQN